MTYNESGAVYSRKSAGSIYQTGEGFFVMGQIRVKGSWNGRIAEPYGWAGGDTGGFFNRE
jgi:hypothetical protein